MIKRAIADLADDIVMVFTLLMALEDLAKSTKLHSLGEAALLIFS